MYLSFVILIINHLHEMYVNKNIDRSYVLLILFKMVLSHAHLRGFVSIEGKKFNSTIPWEGLLAKRLVHGRERSTTFCSSKSKFRS